MGNPYTEYSRPPKQVIDEAVQLIEEADIPSVAYYGTSYEALARLLSERLVQSQGSATSIVCYGGSRFQQSPRNEQTISILVVSADTRTRDGIADALDASWVIGSVLDDYVSDQTDGEGYPRLDKWEAESEEVLDMGSSRAAAAVLMTFRVRQWN